MKFRKFKQEKLWRDKTVDLREQQGSKIHWRKLDDDEFSDQLKIKFMEEAQEVFDAKTKNELLEELADVLEVISALGAVHQFTFQNIIDMQHKKYQERGGFDGRKFVSIAEHPVGSWSEKYCAADPIKSPEIIDL